MLMTKLFVKHKTKKTKRMRKTRRTYVQPTSEVVELHVTNQLLAGSGELNSPNDYEDGGDPLNS